ncbi:unnamed protein product, partial [Musa acuminata var. zebrina]
APLFLVLLLLPSYLSATLSPTIPTPSSARPGSLLFVLSRLPFLSPRPLPMSPAFDSARSFSTSRTTSALIPPAPAPSPSTLPSARPPFRATRLGRLSPLLWPRTPDVARVFTMDASLLTCDPSVHPLPVFHFLLGPVAIPLPDLRKAVGRCPRLLVSSVSDELRTTLLLVSSVEDALLPKLDYLRGLGFSHEETRSMVLRSPCLLTFSIENNFRPKVEFLIHDMGRDLAELKDFPQ